MPLPHRHILPRADPDSPFQTKPLHKEQYLWAIPIALVGALVLGLLVAFAIPSSRVRLLGWGRRKCCCFSSEARNPYVKRGKREAQIERVRRAEEGGNAVELPPLEGEGWRKWVGGGGKDKKGKGKEKVVVGVEEGAR